MLEPLQTERPLLSDTVARRLTQQIIGEAMMPGDSLPSEGSIGKQLGVSKPVVREAVRKLAALGIVEIKQGKPSTVGQLAPEPVRQMLRFAMHINPKGLAEAVELRRALETHAVALAAVAVTDAELVRFRELTDRMKASLRDHDAWVAADLEFHRLIAHCSRNSLIALMIEALSDSMREIISTLHATTKGRDSAVIKRHSAIVDALSLRDGPAAAAAMRAHFDATRPVIELIEEAAPQDK